ncbi:MAG: gliding motility-associated C-terminal domain-containing protein [Bacteroidia bacterium]
MINKKYKLSALFVFMLLLHVTSDAQVQNNPPMRQVLSSTGGTATTPSGNSYDYTVGEVMVDTYIPGSPFTVKALTQGFQQPNSSNSSLNVHELSVNSSCIGANNGSANLQVLASTGTVHYYWYAPINDSTPLQTHLAPGSYPYYISDGTFFINDTIVITEDQVDCGAQLSFYNGITPNADGNNDTWVIDGITNIKENTVSIFNRWGDLVWNCDNYDNVTDGKVWKGKSNKNGELPDATYFYVINAGGKTYKGWVELTH